MSLLVVGMNNPLSARPEHALYPDPVGCTGWRLWQLLQARTGATQDDYVRRVQRVNLVTGRWDPWEAKMEWARRRQQWLNGHSTVLLLGAAVRRATGLLYLPELGIRVLETGRIACLPHPSGLNRWYNSPVHRACAELLMEELYAVTLPV